MQRFLLATEMCVTYQLYTHKEISFDLSFFCLLANDPVYITLYGINVSAGIPDALLKWF